MHKNEEVGENWIENNLVAVPCGAFGNCSACVFRSYQKFCEKMSCQYVDDDTGCTESVYWRALETHANIAMWPELVNWFDNTPPQQINSLAEQVVKKAVFENMR